MAYKKMKRLSKKFKIPSRRYQLCDGICKLVGLRRLVKHQTTFRKSELIGIYKFLRELKESK